MREQFGIMNAGLTETIAGIEVVKSNAQEVHEEEKFVSDAARFRDYFVRQGEIQARYLPMLVFSVAWAGAFLLGAMLWQAGEISAGTVVAYMGLVGTLAFADIYFDLLLQPGAVRHCQCPAHPGDNQRQRRFG